MKGIVYHTKNICSTFIFDKIPKQKTSEVLKNLGGLASYHICFVPLLAEWYNPMLFKHKDELQAHTSQYFYPHQRKENEL